MNKLSKIVSVALVSCLCIAFAAGCSKPGEKIDATKTQIYVANYNGGVGTEWLEKAKTRFEAAYAESTDFEEGKKGVQVVIDPSQSYRDTANFSTLAANKNYVFFTEAVNIDELMRQNLLHDISGMMKENLPGESKTLESKLTDTHKKALTMRDGKYYAVPHYTIYNGVNYDIDLFEESGLYISKDSVPGDTIFLPAGADASRRSAGPDGDPSTTSDNGLPETLDQFIDLCDEMVKKQIVPFIWANGTSTKTYKNFLGNAFAFNNLGPELTEMLTTYDSNGEEIDYIKSFSGNQPEYAKAEITPENGYLLKQHPAIYETLEFLKKVYDKFETYFSNLCKYDTYDNLSAQRDYIYSNLANGNSGQGNSSYPIAMLVEGTYWINESESNEFFANSGVAATERNFGFMPMPTGGSVAGKYNTSRGFTAVDTYSSYAFINKKVESNPVAMKIAEEFLKFCYTDVSLQEFTVTTNIPKGVKYAMPNDQLSKLTSYGKSLWEIKDSGNVVYDISDSKFFTYNWSDLTFTNFFTTHTGTEYTVFWDGLNGDGAAKKYFEGLWYSGDAGKKDWNNYLSKLS